jgi:hypothetical protein
VRAEKGRDIEIGVSEDRGENFTQFSEMSCREKPARENKGLVWGRWERLSLMSAQ